MERKDGFSQLLEFIFGKKATIFGKMIAHSSIPTSLLTEDFSKKLSDVLRMKKKVLFYCFQNTLDGDIPKYLSSYKAYVRYVITNCLRDCDSHRKIFEKFICACAVAMYLSEETLSKTGVDFRDLNPDIVMVAYQNDVIQNPFLKGRDYKRFVEFIRDHRFRRFPDVAAPSYSLRPSHEIEKELQKYRPLPEEGKAAIWMASEFLVQEIFTKTSVKLPTLPSEAGLIEKLVTPRKKDKAKETEKKVREKQDLTDKTPQETPSFISDSKPNCLAAHQEDIEWHESIVQAVRKYNRSNHSHHRNAQNPKLLEAVGTLEHLETSVKTLMELLDEV